jgi:hypothetical protein
MGGCGTHHANEPESCHAWPLEAKATRTAQTRCSSLHSGKMTRSRARDRSSARVCVRVSPPAARLASDSILAGKIKAGRPVRLRSPAACTASAPAFRRHGQAASPGRRAWWWPWDGAASEQRRPPRKAMHAADARRKGRPTPASRGWDLLPSKKHGILPLRKTETASDEGGRPARAARLLSRPWKRCHFFLVLKRFRFIIWHWVELI